MKGDQLEVEILGLEDEKSFNELLAELQVEFAMRMCPKELRLKVLDNALAILTADK